MAKRPSVEQSLDRLRALRATPSSTEYKAELAAALTSKYSYLIAKAAEQAAEYKIELAPELASALKRLLREVEPPDPGCDAKTALAKALLDLGSPPMAIDIFASGVHHVQLDGPPENRDTAGALRGYCALGLLALRHPDAMVELTDLLLDPTVPARTAAARGLAQTGREEAALLLRLKLQLAEADFGVLGECMTALLQLDPKRSISFVSDFLDSPTDDVRDTAALALGESRLLDALDPLQRALARHRDPEARKPLLLAIAMLRRPEAVDVLLDDLKTVRAAAISGTLEALRLYRRDENVRTRAAEIARARGEDAISRAIEAAFAS